ncbi:TrmB family transcriptional regulator [Nanoarchaeota archaeon]
MKQKLIKLGFSNNEAQVYLALLELGSTNAGRIIKKAKLHRNIVYDNLDKLIEKGLVTYITTKGIKYFETTSPKELKEYVNKEKVKVLEKENVVNEILPQIEKRRETIQREDAAIFKGKKGLKNVLEDVTKSKTEIFIFATGWGMKETMGSYFDQWHLKLKENKIKGRALLSKSQKSDYKYPYKIKHVSRNLNLPSTICIFDDKVLNITWKPDLIGFLVVNENVANSYRKWFEELWRYEKK